jgi:hypothetical protein
VASAQSLALRLARRPSSLDNERWDDTRPSAETAGIRRLFGWCSVAARARRARRRSQTGGPAGARAREGDVHERGIRRDREPPTCVGISGGMRDSTSGEARQGGMVQKPTLSLRSGRSLFVLDGMGISRPPQAPSLTAGYTGRDGRWVRSCDPVLRVFQRLAFDRHSAGADPGPRVAGQTIAWSRGRDGKCACMIRSSTNSAKVCSSRSPPSRKSPPMAAPR